MMAKPVDAMDDANGDKISSPSSVSCSICLDLVADFRERSIAKLQCGHEFHLDCIGSAFNMKGAMQCPNCRKIEGGRWLYANGSARSSDFGMDDFTFTEDPYEFSYSEMPFAVHWCPFNGLAGVHSSFEDVEPPVTNYHELQGNHAIFSEHMAASSLAHSHAVYARPVPQASPNSSENVDDPNFSHRRHGQSAQNEIYNSDSFPALNLQYQSWGRHFPPFSANRNHINGGDQALVPPTAPRPTRIVTEVWARAGPFMHPFPYGHGSFPRGGNSFVSSTVHPGGNARSHERIQVSYVTHHQQQPGNPPSMMSPVMPGVRRFNGPRGLPLIVPAVPQSDHHGGIFLLGASGQHPHEAENPLQWERDRLSHFPVISSGGDSGWRPFQPPSGGMDSNNRSGNFWRHWS